MFGKIFVAKRLDLNDQVSRLTNPIVDLVVPFLPTTVSFQVYARILVNNDDQITLPSTVSIILFNSQDSQIAEVIGNIHFENQDSPIQLDVNFENVIITQEGEHRVKLLINDDLVDEYNFYVINKNIELGGA